MGVDQDIADCFYIFFGQVKVNKKCENKKFIFSDNT